MKYREFKKAGKDISLLGFGTMRLPTIDGDDSKINEEEAIKMIRSAIDQGVNYVDTAYMYHGGNSEVVTGKALKDGYREKVWLADKLPVWLAKEEDGGIEKVFEEQFQRLDVDCIDMYLVHNLTSSIWNIAKKYNTLEYLEKQRALGKIKYIGFSFHDEYPLFEEIIDAYPWDFCQIQLNYMDANFQAGVKGLKLAASKGIPVIVMEPLKGGRITDVLPESVAQLWDSAPIKRTPAEWALRWVSDFPEVLTILSGMNNQSQLEENLKILSEADANSLTSEEQEIIKSAGEEYNKLTQYSCTACKYCMPCAAKINIPTAIQYYNDWFLFNKNPKVKNDYFTWLPEGKRASACTECKACEGHCPQSLPISEIMKKTVELFE